jgi:predicted GIY-YIG superfamily endonuclease
MATTNVYVLKLEGGRYYVGKSDDVVNRYKQHMNGSGSAWTRKYKPIGVAKIIENVSVFEEDKITKEYMSKYGIDKVRGGSYVEINLSEFHIEALKMEIWAANNLCTICGRSGHFAKNCYAKTEVLEKKIKNKETSKSGACYRCGRQGHYSPNCYAKTNSDGYELDDDDDDDDDYDDDDDDDEDDDDELDSDDNSDDSY